MADGQVKALHIKSQTTAGEAVTDLLQKSNFGATFSTGWGLFEDNGEGKHYYTDAIALYSFTLTFDIRVRSSARQYQSMWYLGSMGEEPTWSFQG